MKGFFLCFVEVNLLFVLFCREGRIDEVKSFMEECLSKGCDINVVNFIILIYGYCQKDDLEGVFFLFDDMYLVNKRFDIVIYIIIVDVLGKVGKIDEVIGVIKKMLGRGIFLIFVIYRLIIYRYC